MQNKIHRRSFLEKSALLAGTAGLAAAGAAGAPAGEPASENKTKAEDQPDKSAMPYGKIGHLKISRLILGSNLMSGSAHDRDLIYVSSLMKAYNTDEKILDTLELAESLGINTLSQGRPELVRKYNTERGGHMQEILPVRVEAADDKAAVKSKIGEALDAGAAALYVYGHSSDLLVRDGRVDLIGSALDLGHEAGAVIGVGGHALRVVVDCEKAGLKPDFYYKTFHDDDYWSATPKEYREEFCWYKGMKSDYRGYHDNIWCLDPEETTEVMRNVQAPWMAYKVLAAGAYHPRQGFAHAFRNGADFIIVGMFDYQLREDVEITTRLVSRLPKRDRPWRA
jgi:hypothetical protein